MSSQALFCASSPSLLVLIVAISMNDICPVGVNSRGYILWHLCPILLLRNTRFLLFMNPNKISSKPVPSVGCPSSDIEKVFFLFYTTYVKDKGGSHHNWQLDLFTKFNSGRCNLQLGEHNKLESADSASDDLFLAGQPTLQRGSLKMLKTHGNYYQQKKQEKTNKQTTAPKTTN